MQIRLSVVVSCESSFGMQFWFNITVQLCSNFYFWSLINDRKAMCGFPVISCSFSQICISFLPSSSDKFNLNLTVGCYHIVALPLLVFNPAKKPLSRRVGTEVSIMTG